MSEKETAVASTRKEPGWFKALLQRLNLHSESLVAENLGSHHRAQKPLLTDIEGLRVLELAEIWQELVCDATEDYVNDVRFDPTHGDQHFQRYSRKCQIAEDLFRQRSSELINRATAPTGYVVATEEFAELFDLASRYKDWSVRCARAKDRRQQPSRVPLVRARWFLEDYLCRWENPKL